MKASQQFVKTDDIDAFTLVFNEYYPVIYTYVDRMMRNHLDPAMDADDIASETFIRAFEKWKEIQETEKLLGWLQTTAKNLVIDQIRKSRRRARYLLIESLDNLSVREREVPFASILVETDTCQTEAIEYLVRQLLCLLQGKDREIVELKLAGLSTKEMAKAIGSTAGAIQKRWERLIKWLKPVAVHLDSLVDYLPEEYDRKVMERYLDGQPLLEIAKAIGISCSVVEQTVKRVIARWKKAANQNSTNLVSALAKNRR